MSIQNSTGGIGAQVCRPCRPARLALPVLGVLLLCTGRAAGGAYTYVQGAVGDYLQSHRSEGPHAASGSGLNGSFLGAADAFLTHQDYGDTEIISLHAFAQATCPSDGDTEFGPPNVRATAEWTDVLRVANRDVVPQPLLGNLYFYFIPQFHGTTIGRGGNATLSLSVGSQSWSDTEKGGGPFSVPVPVKVGGNIFGLISGSEEVPPVDFDMRLEAMAIATPSDSPALADISHTVEFGPIYIGDANGNPLPYTPPIQFVGDSGTVYDTAPIPEPSAALMACGAAALLLRRRARRHLL